MPIYEYECSLCDVRFERKQRFDDEPVTMCPNCQGKVRRVIHSAPVIFKGSGFYITDSRKGSAIGPEQGEKDKKESPGKGKREQKEAKEKEAVP